MSLTELVADEVEVPLSSEPVDEESDDFVEGDAAVDDVVGGMECRHSRVHLLVHQPEREGLVADQRLEHGQSFNVKFKLTRTVCRLLLHCLRQVLPT